MTEPPIPGDHDEPTACRGPAPAPSGAARRGPTHPALRAELVTRAERDQYARLHDMSSADEVDAENLAFLAPLLDRYGWLGVDRVGEDGAHACWLLVQHSPPDEQDRRLPALRDAVARGVAARRDLAYLQDRVDTHHDRPQTYGTQSVGFSSEEPRLWPVHDPATVNVLRAELGMAPITEQTLAAAWTEQEITARRGGPDPG